MKNKTYFLNTILALVLSVALLIAVIVRTFSPAVVIPSLNIPNIVLLSLAALLLDHYLAPGAKRCYLCIALFSAVSFGLLPFAASFVGAMEAVKLGIVGGIVFTAITWAFTSMMDRLSSGPAAKAAPAVSAVCLLLAAQIFNGMIL